MSAREELFESLTPTYRAQFAPGEEDSVNALLDAYRDEVLREAAEQIREACIGMYPHGLCPAVSTGKGAANLIDPRTDTSYLNAVIESSREAWKEARR
jgi:hypothetical protein